jgi:hypothetical protein
LSERSFSYERPGERRLIAVRLEDIKNGASVRGVASAQAVHVISVDWIGDQAISVVYRDHNGSVAEAVLYRDDEHRLEVEQSGRACWRSTLTARCCGW